MVGFKYLKLTGMTFSVRQLLHFIGILSAIFLVSCRDKSSFRDTFNFSNSKKSDSIEVQRLMALSKKSLLTDYSLGIKQAIQATEIAERTTNIPLTYDAYKLAAGGALHAGTFDVAEVYLQKFLNLAESEHDDKMLGRAYANLAMLHLFINNPKEADSLFNKGLRLIKNHAAITHEEIPSEDQVVIYLNLGHIYEEQNKYPLAEKMYLTGLEMAKSVKIFANYEGQLTQSLGLLYLKMKQLPKAKLYFDNSMRLQTNLQNTSLLAVGFLGYGQYYEQIQQIDEAIKSYEKGMTLAEQVNSIDLQVELSDHLYKIFKTRKDYEKAFYYLNLNVEKKEIEKKQQTKEGLARKSIQRNLKTEEMKIAEQQHKNNVFIAIFIFMIISIATFYVWTSMKARKEINILLQENQQQEILKEELEFTHQQMTSQALQAMQKDETLQQIVQKIKNNQQDEVLNSQILKSISKDLEKINVTKNWDEFEKRFVGIHANFFQNLFAAHPNLSSNERRLCAFLRLDMSTKEISSLTGQSVRAIELSRIRLRKKLLLTKSDVGIFQYLAEF
jgi:tetratricopeptide (TPR) repeat protein